MKENQLSARSSENFNFDILIVSQNFKKYVKNRFDPNTSGDVIYRLRGSAGGLVDNELIATKRDGRQTLMDPNFQ